ncbi:MAG: FGGY family carbohydrate kinase [Oscillospiraceae bacterium]|nr:FGGY family carbohydrate kinase [Oscillospiraceae bacterium]
MLSYLIGVDIGTQGTKTALLDENGNLIQDAFEPSRLLYPGQNAVTQDPEEMLGSVIRTIRTVMDASGLSPGAVAAVGISGQMAGIMGVGADGMAATPYDSWLDTRCGKYRQPFLDFGEGRVISLTGTPITYAHGPKTLWWKNEHPDVYRKIHKFIQPSAYCVMRLCGLRGDDAFTDHTYIHFSGFADTGKRQWSDELLYGMDVKRDKLPRILRPYDIAGRLTAEMAAQCGLAQGTPFAAGCGDTAASAFGAGIISSGLLFDVSGTASVLACATDIYNPDVKHKTILYASSVIEGLFTPMAYINGGGLCLRWMRDDVLGKEKSFSELDSMAEKIPPGSGDLIFIPHFTGRVCPNDSLVRGSYIGLGLHHKSAHLYRAVMEGIAYEYGIYADIMRELVPTLDFERVISVGGGSISAVFAGIKADVLGIPISTIALADTASLACCAIAGYGVGLYEGVTSLVERSMQIRSTVLPDQGRHEFYLPRKRIYEKSIGDLHGVYGELLGLSPV